jgi:hypothetical protein
MPFTILKSSKGGDVEVIGEFGTQAEADAFVQGVRVEDPDTDYIVECPPVPDSHKRPDKEPKLS